MKIKLTYKVLILFFTVALFGVLYYNVTLNYPLAFGDEGYYSSVARWISENKILPFYEPYWETDAYKQIFLHLPLFIITLIVPWFFLGEVGIKLLLPVFAILSSFMIYIFIKNFERKKSGLAAALIFLSTPALITYAVMAYTDSLLALFFLCSAYFGYLSFEKNKKIPAIISGVFAALAMLTKATGLLTVVFIFAYFILFRKFKQWKLFGIFLISMILIFSPYLIRNILNYGSFCYSYLPNSPGTCSPFVSKEIQTVSSGLDFAGRIQETGTEVTLYKMGIHNFANFAFGWTISILLIFGIVNVLLKKQNFGLFILLLFLAFTPLFLSATRAEDVARYIVPMVVPIAIIAGLFVADCYSYLKKYHIAIAVMFMVIFFVSVWFYGQEKINTMAQVKQFAPSFFEGCKWIKMSTPKNSTMLSLHAHPTAYNCDRAVQWELPDKGLILLTNNDTSYEHLKLHGIDYVYVQYFSLSAVAYGQTYPLAFVQYMESSDKFKKVFDNSNVYGRSGVAVYQVL